MDLGGGSTGVERYAFRVFPYVTHLCDDLYFGGRDYLQAPPACVKSSAPLIVESENLPFLNF